MAVGVCGFILGTLSSKDAGHGIVIENAQGDFLAAPKGEIAAPAPAGQKPLAPPSVAGAVVASQNGEVYYPPGCAGISRIKEENRISFASAALAEQAGYRPAKKC